MPTKIPLIVRLPNWVGDVVMTLPSLYALHAVGFDLQLMGRPWIVDLLQALPATLYSQQSGFRQGASKCKRKYMTNQPLAPAQAGGAEGVYTPYMTDGERTCNTAENSSARSILPISQSMMQARREVCRATATKALLFPNSFSSALIFHFAGKETVGYAGNFRNGLLTHPMAKPQSLHEVEYFWKIAQFAASTWLYSQQVGFRQGASKRDKGVSTEYMTDGERVCNTAENSSAQSISQVTWPEAIPTTIHLPISHVSKLKIAELLQQKQIQKPFVVLCPSATGTAKNGIPKIWPYWSDLSNTLAQQGVLHIVCPGPQEEARCEQLTPKATILTGIRLNELAALFEQATVVIANDSGPMHLAAASGASVVGLFGATSPERTRPWGGRYLGELGRWPSLTEVLETINQSL